MTGAHLSADAPQDFRGVEVVAPHDGNGGSRGGAKGHRRAAEHLRVAQPPLSQAIATFERELGITPEEVLASVRSGAAEIAHRASILPMVLNGLGRAVMPSSWRRMSTPHVAAMSRRTHLTTPAIALMGRSR